MGASSGLPGFTGPLTCGELWEAVPAERQLIQQAMVRRVRVQAGKQSTDRFRCQKPAQGVPEQVTVGEAVFRKES